MFTGTFSLFIYKDIMPFQSKVQKCQVCGETTPSMFYAKRKTKCKECVKNEQYRNLNESDKQAYKDRIANSIESKLLRYRWTSARNRAKAKGLVFEISFEFVEKLWETQKGVCYLTNVPMKLEMNVWNSVSIDRINSQKGYVEGNVALATSFINYAKRDYSNIELKNILTEIRL